MSWLKRQTATEKESVGGGGGPRLTERNVSLNKETGQS